MARRYEEPMSEEAFANLEGGDIIRHVATGEGFVVHGNYKRGGVLIVKAQLAHNYAEWKLVEKARGDERAF